jgi:hypothetical protein
MDFRMIHKSICSFLLPFVLCQGFCFSVLAQSHYDPEEAPAPTSLSLLDQTKSDFYIITAAGLSGAVLGLSTLSFATSPSDHLDHIWTGAAVGLICGVLYVAYRQALGPGGMWSDASMQEGSAYNLLSNPADIFKNQGFAMASVNSSLPISMAWNFTF